MRSPSSQTSDIVWQLALAHESSPDAVWCVDRDMTLVYANEAALDLVERRLEQALGHRCWEVFGDGTGMCEGCLAVHALAEGRAKRELARDPASCVAARLERSWHPAGAGLVVETGHDDSELVSMRREVQERTRAARDLEFRSLVLDHTTETIVVHRFDGTVLWANDGACAQRGYAREEFLDLPPFAWIAPESREAAVRAGVELRARGAAVYEAAMVSRDGTVTHQEVHASAVPFGHERVVVTTGRDITERLEAQETISRMAFYDSLTGLANRALFFDRLEHAIATAAPDDSRLAVIFLDLDHFKGVNDTLGHHTGDVLLRAVARRLTGHLREGDTIARIGGDEFTVVLENVASRQDVERLATKLLACFREPFEDIEGQELYVTASMGIVMSRGADRSAETLVAQADTAMYTAKDSGRNAYSFYVSHMSDAAKRRFDLKNDLRGALPGGQLTVRYQPQFRVADGRLVGVEALLRWTHPRHGPVSPTVFLPLAEESGQIFAIGEWTLRQGCEQARRWHTMGADTLRMAINLSARQFEDPRLVSTVAGVLASTGVPPSLLELEITETVATRDTERMRRTFEELRALGVRIAVDDFGTGFSSLGQLMNLDVDTLKIDGRFIQDLGRNAQAAAITNSVVFLAHQLGLNVIAEGVETDEHFELLEHQGCDEMQGFLMGRPMSVAEVDALIARLLGCASPRALGEEVSA